MLKRCSVLLVATLLAACGGATTFDQFSLEEGLSARMDASQRVVLVSNRGGKDGNRHVVCAEPSPDSIISASAILSSKLERESTDPATKLLGSASAQATFATAQNAAFVGMRTQTIQLLRDGLYRACEAYMNGAIDETEYNMLLVNMPRVMTALIAIDGLTARPAAPAVVNMAPTVSSTADGTTTVQGAAVVTLDKDGKPVQVSPAGAIMMQPAMGGDKLSETAAAAVYGITQTMQQSRTMPAVCVALLKDERQAYRNDPDYLIVRKYCKDTLALDALPKQTFTPPDLPAVVTKTKPTAANTKPADPVKPATPSVKPGDKADTVKTGEPAACQPASQTCPKTSTTTTTVTTTQ